MGSPPAYDPDDIPYVWARAPSRALSLSSMERERSNLMTSTRTDSKYSLARMHHSLG